MYHGSMSMPMTLERHMCTHAHKCDARMQRIRAREAPWHAACSMSKCRPQVQAQPQPEPRTMAVDADADADVSSRRQTQRRRRRQRQATVVAAVIAPHAFLPSHPPASLDPTCTSLPPYLSTFLPSYPPTFLPPYLPTFLPSYLPTFLPSYPPTLLPSYLPIFLHVHRCAAITGLHVAFW